MHRAARPFALLAASLAATALALTGCSATGSTPSGVSTPPRTPVTTVSSPSPSTPPTTAPVTPTNTAPTNTSPTPPPSDPNVPPVTAAPPRAATSPTRHPSAPAPPGPSYPPGTGPLVVLDPGHNGANWSHPAEINKQVPAGFGRYKACNTTGTNTDAGYPEHEFTFKVATRVRAVLQRHGVRVIMTRPNDSGVGPCVNVRAEIQSRPGVVAAVSIHADGGPASGRGFHVCYDSRRPDGATAATMTKSKALSTAVHDALAHGSGLVPSTYIGHDGYYPRSDMAGLNLSTSPTTFLELGNMRNAHDAALLSSAAGQQRIAAAVAAGILAYLARR